MPVISVFPGAPATSEVARLVSIASDGTTSAHEGGEMASLKSRQPVTAGARVTTRCYSPNIELHWSPSAIASEE